MHELGIVCEVIRIVDDFVKENDVQRVERIVLEVGQLSQAIPRYIEECYPAAVDGTPYEDTDLAIISVPANGRCHQCSEIYNIVEERKVCPACGDENFELVTGNEFTIKEIIGY